MLSLRSVSAGYGGAPVLHGVSIEVGFGEMVALIGANGAGKSTTLRCVSGVIHPSSGEIYLESRDLRGLKPEAIAALGVAHVPEGRRVFPGMTVKENLEIGALALGMPAKEVKKSVEEALAVFPRLRDRYSKYAWSLSGGEQQMLVIGRGLVARPRLLLLDEPSLGLAPLVVDQVFRAIEDVRQRLGMAILLVEQNASIALQYADRAYVLELGRVALAGPSRELENSDLVRESYLGVGDTL